MEMKTTTPSEGYYKDTNLLLTGMNFNLLRPFIAPDSPRADEENNVVFHCMSAHDEHNLGLWVKVGGDFRLRLPDKKDEEIQRLTGVALIRWHFIESIQHIVYPDGSTPTQERVGFRPKMS